MRSQDALVEAFGVGGPMVTSLAPGRVNLIGEHTDYNDGYVLPMAIEAGIDLSARLAPGRTVRLHAADYAQSVAFSLDAPLAFDAEHPWSNYGRGVLWALAGAGVKLEGLDLAFRGDLPQGAGLSSSAALEVATAVAVKALLGFEMEPPRLALLCQKAENEFVGLKCGIMDQFVSLMGERDHALFLDCRSLAFEHIPLVLGEHLIAICHSGVKHSLVASEYNRRRQQCGEGVAALRNRYPEVRALRDASLPQLEACRGAMTPEVHRRCRHVISECDRVLESASALRAGDLARFGALMNASHDSQRDDYQVSCEEVDLLVDLARAVPGVLGARITGGGFGGCTVNLVTPKAREAFEEKVLAPYWQRTGKVARLFVSRAGRGARLVEGP